MVRGFLYCISLLILAMLTQWYFSLRRNYRDGAKGLAVKAAGTFVSVFLCFYAVAEQSAWGKKWMLLAGVAVCMAADAVIGVDFVAGMLTFLAAHVFFILYFFTLAPFHPASLIIFAVLYLVQGSLYGKYIFKLGRKIPAYAVYPAALSLMFSVAVFTLIQRPGAGTLCLALGAGLFLISDSILADAQLRSNSFWKDRLVMYLYYPAVYLLAVSAFYV